MTAAARTEMAEARLAALMTLLGAVATCSPRRDSNGRLVDFRIEELNDEAARAHGDQLGRGLLETYPCCRDNGLFDALCSTMETGAPLAYDAFECAQQVLEIRAAKSQEVVVVAWRDVTERARAHAQLRARAKLLDTVEQAVIATDLDGTITYWNRFAERLYGWSAHEAVGRSIQDTTPSQVSRDQAEAIMARLRTGESWAGEFLVQRRDGTSFPALVTDTPISDEHGHLVGIVGISSDLTEWKRAEEELAAALEREQAASRQAAESLALLDVLVDTAPVGIAFFDRDLRYVRINQEAADMNGLPVEAHRGRTLREIVPAMADTAEPLLRHVLETGEPIRDRLLTGETPRAPGMLGVWRQSYYPIHGGSGEVVGVGAIALEVTEQQRLAAERERLLGQERAARAEAEAQRTWLREVLDVLPEAVLLADGATRTVVLNNRASVALIGADLVGQLVPSGAEPAHGSKRFDGTPIPSEQLPLQRALQGEAVIGAQYVHHHLSEDRDVPVLANSAPLHDAAGALVGALCVFQDISAMRDLDQQKDEFLATVSHDLQQPLALIKARAQLVRRRLARGERLEPSHVAESLTTIEAAVNDMAGQLTELLDATRLQMGRPLELVPASIDLVTFIQDMVATWDETSPGHSLRLETALEGLEASVDASRLRRVVANLLSNAVKYSPSGGHITVRLRREPQPDGRAVAVVEVQDNGVGIPVEDVPHIFERFYRGRNAAQAARGSGIGLAGVKQIVEQHGGTIQVTSTEGAGSTFTVRLPI